MNCDRALEALLDADLPDALSGRAPLAMHVQSCNRCRAVADMLIGETQTLARAVAVASPRGARRSQKVIALPAMAAATLLVMVATRNTERTPDRTALVLAPVTVQPAATLTVAPEAEPERPVLRAFPQALPVAAVKLETGAPVVAQSAVVPSGTATVSVTPASGTRAVVMHTNDPRLVVVWLY